MLLWDDAAFGLQKARKADVYVYTKSTHKDPSDYYVTDASLKPGRKLTSADEQVKAFTWSSGQMLVEYTFTLNKAKGPQRLQGSLSLPANYEKGKQYPMVVYIYEKLTQGHNSFATPTANGFNKSVYTSNGYAVLQPDITYALNDPGVSAVACITAAVKAAIATGVVDPKRIGLQGHSWGGYQTAFTVTQTNIFAAAVAGAPLTNMVSMYSLIYKNSGGTNQAIFESSQGRFLGSYSDNWEAYVRNSPVNFAKNVRTPLIILHNDKDGAVDFTQGVEYLQHAPPPREERHHAGVRGREPRAGQAREPVRLHDPHEGVLRPLPEGRAGAGVDDRRRAAPRDGRPPQGAGEPEEVRGGAGEGKGEGGEEGSRGEGAGEEVALTG